MVTPPLDALPPPEPAAEEAWVRAWGAREDLDGLVDAITRAVAARRPQLAARLFLWLEDRVEIAPGSELDRARRAAAFFLVPRGAEPDAEAELDAAWALARRGRMLRILRRMRGRPDLGPLGLPLGGARRGPFLTGPWGRR